MQQVAQRTSSKAVDFSFFFFSFRNFMTGFSLQVVLNTRRYVPAGMSDARLAAALARGRAAAARRAGAERK